MPNHGRLKVDFFDFLDAPLEFGNRSIYLVRSGEDFELDFGNSQSLATRHVSCAPSLD